MAFSIGELLLIEHKHHIASTATTSRKSPAAVGGRRSDPRLELLRLKAIIFKVTGEWRRAM
jgi:hypothetical protein